MTQISADIDAVYDSAVKLKGQLSGIVLPTDVERWTGPAEISESKSLQNSVGYSGAVLADEIDVLLRMLDEHGDSLRAAAETLDETESSATTTAEQSQQDVSTSARIADALDQADSATTTTRPDAAPAGADSVTHKL
jgi:hypothetical protein